MIVAQFNAVICNQLCLCNMYMYLPLRLTTFNRQCVLVEVCPADRTQHHERELRIVSFYPIANTKDISHKITIYSKRRHSYLHTQYSL